MKLSEFRVEVEKLGLEVVKRPGIYYVVDGSGIEWLVASVSSQEVCVMTTGYYSHMIDEATVRKLFHILVRFAQTTIQARAYEEDENVS